MARLLKNTMSVVVFGGAVLLGSANSTSASNESWLAMRGQWPTGQSQATAVADGYVYYGKGVVLVAAVINSPDSLEIVGDIPLPDRIMDVEVSGNYAYVATWGAGLRIVDISTPARPIEVGVVETDEELMAIDVSGDFLVMASRLDGLLAFDVSTPSTPVEVYSYDDSLRFFDVVMTDDYVYAVDCFDGFFAFSRSPPSILKLIGQVALDYCPGSVAVADDTAFVGTYSDGFRVFDVRAPWAPREVGNLSSLERIHGIDTVGSTAVVANAYGVTSVDASDPTTPVAMGFVGTDFVSWAVTVDGDHAFVGTGGGLEVIDVGDPSNLEEVVGLEQPVDIRGLAAVESLIFAADGYRGLWVVDVKNPRSPIEIGFAEKRGEFPVSVVVEGNHAFLTDVTGLQILSVLDPSNPITVGYFETSGFAFDVAFSTHFAFIADYGDQGGLLMLDVSDPSLPVEVGYLDSGTHNRRVVAVDRLVYVGDDHEGLLVFDVSDPTAPLERSRTPLAGIRVEDLTVENGIAFVAQYGGAVQFIDVSNPDNPVEIGNLDWVYWPTGITVVGDALFLTEWEEGMHQIDISDLSAPVEVEFFETPGAALAVEALDNRVYLSDGDLGVRNLIPRPHRYEPIEAAAFPD